MPNKREDGDERAQKVAAYRQEMEQFGPKHLAKTVEKFLPPPEPPKPAPPKPPKPALPQPPKPAPRASPPTQPTKTAAARQPEPEPKVAEIKLVRVEPPPRRPPSVTKRVSALLAEIPDDDLDWYRVVTFPDRVTANSYASRLRRLHPEWEWLSAVDGASSAVYVRHRQG